MKNITMLAGLSALSLTLLPAQVVYAEPSDAVKGIYEALVAEDSDYSAEKALYDLYNRVCGGEQR